MADEVVGSVYVIIRAIADKIRKDIKDGVEKSVDDQELEKAGGEIGDGIGKSAGEHASTRIADEVEKVSEKVDHEKVGKSIGDPIGDSAGRSFSERMSAVMTDESRKRFKNISKDIVDEINKNDSFGSRLKGMFKNAFSKAETDVVASKFGGNIGKKIGTALGGGFGSIPLRPAIMAALVPVAGSALQVLSSYVAGATSLLASLGPAIVGSAAAGIGTYAALGQAIGGVTLALKTQTPELATFKKQMLDLKPTLNKIGESVQKTLFPTLAKNIKEIANNLLPVLTKRLGQTGTVLAGVSTKFANLSKSPVFQSNLSKVMGTNNAVIGKLGGALVHVASAFVAVLAAARPAIMVFANWASHLAKIADSAAKAGTESGKLSAFFKRAADSMHQWGRILGNFGTALFNILKIAKPFGDNMTNSIEKVSKKFRDWTESAGGMSKIQGFFKSMMPIMHQFNLLIRDIFKATGKGIIDPKGNKNTVEFIKALRLQLLPAVVKILGQLNKLGPSITQLTGTFSKLLDSLAKSGALTSFANAINGIFKVINALLAIPFVPQLIGWALAFAAVSKAMNLASFGMFSKLTGSLGKSIGTAAVKTKLFQTVALNAKTAVFLLGNGLKSFGAKILPAVGKGLGGFAKLLPKLASGMSSIASKVIPLLIGGLRSLGIAMLTNPIGIIILALVALGVAIVLLWKKSETFRKIIKAGWADIKAAMKAVADWFVNDVGPAFATAFNWIKNAAEDVFKWLKSNWPLILGILSGPIGLIVVLIVKNFDKIKSFIIGVWNAIKDAASKVWNGIKNVVSVAVGLVKALITREWDGIKKISSTVWNGVKAVVSGAINGVKAVVSRVVDFIKTVIQRDWNLIKRISSTVWNGIRAVISGVLNAIRAVVSRVTGAIRSAISAAWNAARNVTVRAWNGIKNAVSSAIGGLLSLVRSLPGKIVSALGNLGSLLYNAGKSIISGLVHGISSMVGTVKNAVGGVLSAARNLLPFSPAKEGPFSGKGWTLYSGRSISEALAQGIKDRGKVAISATADVVKGVHAGISGTHKAFDRLRPNATTGRSVTARAAAAAGSTSNTTKNIKIVNNYPKPVKSDEAVFRSLQKAAHLGIV